MLHNQRIIFVSIIDNDNESISDMGIRIWHHEKLINKYYQILYNKLNEADKQSLKLTHDKWMSFKTAENDLTEKLANEEYSGGGSYVIIGIAYERMLLNKSRATAYYEKLLGIVM